MKERLRKRPVQLAAVLLSLTLITGIVFGCQALFDPHGNRIVEGVTIGGLDVGGMSRREAKEALGSAALETVLTQALPVYLPEEILELTPNDLGAELQTGKAVRDAFRVDRKKDCTVKELDLLSYLDLNRDAIRSALQEYADTYDTHLTQPSFRVEGSVPELTTQQDTMPQSTQVLYITLGFPTAHLDVENALEEILDTFSCAIAACRTGSYEVSITVPETERPDVPDLDALYQEFSIAPVNDTLDMQTYGFVHGSYGHHFDMDAAVAAVKNAYYGETVSIPMECLAPEILGEGAYFRDVLGSCDTRHDTNENRNTNLRLVCEALDGLILQPGEEFSYNEAVGERTPERGFKLAPSFSGNRLANSYGGGVCQGSSTLYNCVLIADLEVTERVCHGGVITYLPLGLDAAVSWGYADFCFRNSANFPIMIKAEVSDGYMRMKILGTDEKDFYILLKANSWYEGDVIYASSRKYKYDKETDELISRDIIAYSTYYQSVG